MEWECGVDNKACSCLDTSTYVCAHVHIGFHTSCMKLLCVFKVNCFAAGSAKNMNEMRSRRQRKKN